eukprot:scaffold13191_cov178-Amphora_coffeaeformis.AAC.8
MLVVVSDEQRQSGQNFDDLDFFLLDVSRRALGRLFLYEGILPFVAQGSLFLFRIEFAAAMPPSPIKRRRPTDSEFDPSAAAAAPGPAPKLSHRLFSHNNKKRKASSRTAEVVVQAAPLPRRKKQAVAPPPPAPVEEGPDISILEGITRGSIANMVLARLGKLNPNELIGAAPSKPVRADQFQEDDEDGDESTDHRDDGGEPKEDDGEPSGTTKDDEIMVQAHDDDDDEDEEEPEPVEKGQIKFRDAVKPQPVSEDPPDQEMEGIYLTDDGSVATVHESQVSKTSSTLPSSHSYNRVKLTNDDKKNFVEDVKWPSLIECCGVFFFLLLRKVAAWDISERKRLPPEEWKRQTLSRLP